MFWPFWVTVNFPRADIFIQTSWCSFAIFRLGSYFKSRTVHSKHHFLTIFFNSIFLPEKRVISHYRHNMKKCSLICFAFWRYGKRCCSYSVVQLKSSTIFSLIQRFGTSFNWQMNWIGPIRWEFFWIWKKVTQWWYRKLWILRVQTA